MSTLIIHREGFARAASIALFIFFGFALRAQTYVGEIEKAGGPEYMKLISQNDSIFVSFPYELRRRTFGIKIAAKTGNTFSTTARGETRNFDFEKQCVT